MCDLILASSEQVDLTQAGICGQTVHGQTFWRELSYRLLKEFQSLGHLARQAERHTQASAMPMMHLFNVPVLTDVQSTLILESLFDDPMTHTLFRHQPANGARTTSTSVSSTISALTSAIFSPARDAAILGE